MTTLDDKLTRFEKLMDLIDSWSPAERRSALNYISGYRPEAIEMAHAAIVLPGRAEAEARARGERIVRCDRCATARPISDMGPGLTEHTYRCKNGCPTATP